MNRKKAERVVLMNDLIDERRNFLESLGIKTDGFHGIGEQYTAIHSLINARGTAPQQSEIRDMLAACFFCIRKQQEQIAELKERLK